MQSHRSQNWNNGKQDIHIFLPCFVPTLKCSLEITSKKTNKLWESFLTHLLHFHAQVGTGRPSEATSGPSNMDCRLSLSPIPPKRQWLTALPRSMEAQSQPQKYRAAEIRKQFWSSPSPANLVMQKSRCQVQIQYLNSSLWSQGFPQTSPAKVCFIGLLRLILHPQAEDGGFH